jgi:antitoxin component HigA of HigAB toxin-antitoxin module
MEEIINKLRKHQSDAPSGWRADAAYRAENRSWLRYSQHIAMLMLDRMEELGLTQKALAEQMCVSQQYVSKILKGRENLTLDTLAKIEEHLHIHVLTLEYA